MDVVLTPAELRVLGVLIEKESTTPDQYPLTLNGLLLAANQTSNRNPVVDYGADVALDAVGHLRELGLARVVHSPSNRAEKYRHVVGEAWGLSQPELAVLAVLALRGPQTAGELQTRTERYGDLADMGGVDGVLHRLKNRYDEPYVVRLGRQTGQREERWAHLLAGEVLDVAPAPLVSRGPGSGERVAALESRVGELEGEMTRLQAQFAELRGLLG